MEGRESGILLRTTHVRDNLHRKEALGVNASMHFLSFTSWFQRNLMINLVGSREDGPKGFNKSVAHEKSRKSRWIDPFG